MMRIAIAALVFAFGIADAVATPQTPDKIVYQGTLYDLQTYPMDPYFEKYPDKRPKIDAESSALRRKYIAKFEIQDRRIFLTRIDHFLPLDASVPGLNRRKRVSFMKQLVPDGGKLAVDWYTGTLELRYGGVRTYDHSPQGSIFNKYILLEVVKGTVSGEKKMNGTQFEAYRNKLDGVEKTDAPPKADLPVQTSNSPSVDTNQGCTCSAAGLPRHSRPSSLLDVLFALFT